MKKSKLVFLALLFIVLGVSGASAATINLYDWAFYIDGTIYEKFAGDSMPTSGTLTPQGLGTLTWSTSTAGLHTFIAFFDHEIDEAINTFFNEYGTVSGSPSSGQSWEIDEPGYVFGDIYWNVLAGSLDNSNAVPGSTPDDVSMALGWNFTLNAGESATITLILSDTTPGSGFYLSQIDPESNATIYFSSNINIQGNGTPVVEPTTILLFGSGLLGLWGLRRKFKK